MALFSDNKADRNTPEFFSDFADASTRSSRIVLGEVFRHYQPNSIHSRLCDVPVDTRKRVFQQFSKKA